MTLSATVAQQRAQEAKLVKRWIAYGLVGSVGLHVLFLLLKTGDLWKAKPAVQEEIAIVVSEPIAPEVEAEAAGDSGAGGGSAALEPFEPFAGESNTALLDAPPQPAPQSIPQEQPSPTAAEEPVAVADPNPTEPLPTATASPVASPTPQASPQPIASPQTTPSPTESATAPTTDTGRLRNLLDQLRRDREARRTAGQEGRSGPFGRSSGSGTGTGTGTGSGVGSGSGPGPDSGVGSGSAPGPGSGNRAAAGSGSGESTIDRPEQGRARQVACRNCPEPDYPEAALEAGAEGKVSVSVDVDENGRVVGVTLTGSSGNAALDQAVLETVRQRYEFEGVGAGGVTIPIEVDMTLEGSDANRAARERGNQRSIEVAPPAAAEAPAAPETAAGAVDSPTSAPAEAPAEEEALDSPTASPAAPAAEAPESAVNSAEPELQPIPDAAPAAESETPQAEPLPEPVEAAPLPAPEPLPEPVTQTVEPLPEPVEAAPPAPSQPLPSP